MHYCAENDSYHNHPIHWSLRLVGGPCDKFEFLMFGFAAEYMTEPLPFYTPEKDGVAYYRIRKLSGTEHYAGRCVKGWAVVKVIADFERTEPIK